MENIDFAKHYENLAENWANHLDTQFDTNGRPFELCLQLINALWDVYPEIIEFIEIDPNAFAERVSMYRLALHSFQNQPSGYEPAPM